MQGPNFLTLYGLEKTTPRRTTQKAVFTSSFLHATSSKLLPSFCHFSFPAPESGAKTVPSPAVPFLPTNGTGAVEKIDVECETQTSSRSREMI